MKNWLILLLLVGCALTATAARAQKRRIGLGVYDTTAGAPVLIAPLTVTVLSKTQVRLDWSGLAGSHRVQRSNDKINWQERSGRAVGFTGVIGGESWQFFPTPGVTGGSVLMAQGASLPGLFVQTYTDTFSASVQQLYWRVYIDDP